MKANADSTASIRRGDSSHLDTRQAIAEIDAMLSLQTAALSVLFFDPKHDRKIIAEEIERRSLGARVIACSSAGEIGTKGYQRNSIAGFSLLPNDFNVSSGSISSLKDFSVDQAQTLTANLLSDLKSQSVKPSGRNCFALLLIDGLSVSEEMVAFKLQEALQEIPLIGGSAGDSLNFKETLILSDGVISSDRAVLAIVCTKRPFKILKEQTIHPTETKIVVTDADSKRRIINEINGEPAANEYARLLGLDGPEELNSVILSENPLMLQLGDKWYIRSPYTVNADNSMSLYCSIETGLVLSIGRHYDLTSSLKENLESVLKKLGHVQLLIACDCIQRRLRIEAHDQVEIASQIMRDFNAIGFSTYGEQYGSIHANQTLTAIAIG